MKKDKEVVFFMKHRVD